MKISPLETVVDNAPLANTSLDVNTFSPNANSPTVTSTSRVAVASLPLLSATL